MGSRKSHTKSISSISTASLFGLRSPVMKALKYSRFFLFLIVFWKISFLLIFGVYHAVRTHDLPDTSHWGTLTGELQRLAGNPVKDSDIFFFAHAPDALKISSFILSFIIYTVFLFDIAVNAFSSYLTLAAYR